MQITLPSELCRYWKEMGDGFQLWYSAEPITGNTDDQFWWTIDCLGDIIGDYQGIRDQMARNINGEGDFCLTEQCQAESRIRINWIPIFGIGGGGYTFCIDANEGHGEIRFHDIRMSDGDLSSICLAASIDDWMTKWSRFCFSQPLWDGTDRHGFLESYCWGREGNFDWNSSKFRANFDLAHNGQNQAEHAEC